METIKDIVQKNIKELVPYKNNARTHDDKQVKQLVASIKEFGFNNPILIHKGKYIVAGHGRLLAAIELGMKTVPCANLEHLSDAQKRAYIIADNQLALNAGWDLDLLGLEVKDIDQSDIDTKLLGFEDEMLKGLLGTFEAGTDDDQGQLDEKDMIYITCPNCKEEFEKGQAQERKADS